MQKIEKLYRTSYTGEKIIKKLTYQNNAWTQDSEFVTNQVTNNQISNRAVIIGNGPSRLELYPQGDLLQILKNHRGGLLANKAVQTYGCNALYQDFTPDFLVASNDMTHELANSNYCGNHIVYSSADAVLTYPGKFYLTPQNPSWDAGAIAAYLACFDGHKQVYLMGFDHHTNEQFVNYNVYHGTTNYPDFISPNTQAFFVKTMTAVMNTYGDVDFVRVVPDTDWWCPEDWKYLINFRQISFRDFVLEVDL
jgi:hypothetical protein